MLTRHLVGPTGALAVAALLVAATAATATADPTQVFSIAGSGAPAFAVPGPATLGGLDAGSSAAVVALPAGGYAFTARNGTRIVAVDAQGSSGIIAGAGAATGDGGSAYSASIKANGLAVLPDGSLLVAEDARVRRISPEHVITTVAGTGATGSAGDGGPSSAATFTRLSAISPTPDGGYVVLDSGAERVRKIAPDGTISTLAGDGHEGFYGDLGPAVNARFKLDPGSALLAMPDGRVLISDTGNDRVRSVTPDGVIATVAGTGDFGRPFRAGTPALDADIGSPSALAPDGAGGVFVLSSGTPSRIFHLTADGRASTVGGADAGALNDGPLAGRGTGRANGDGGPLRTAPLGAGALATAANGDLLLLDQRADRVRLLAGAATSTPAAALQTVRAQPGRLTLGLRTTVPATVRIRLARGRHRLRARHRQVGAGATTIAVRGAFGRGVVTITVDVTPAGFAPIRLEDAVVFGRITLADARAALARRLSVGAGLSQLHVRRCVRFGASRIDCQVVDDFISLRCDSTQSILPGPGGAVTTRSYACDSLTDPFRRHPQYQSRPGAPLPLFDPAAAES